MHSVENNQSTITRSSNAQCVGASARAKTNKYKKNMKTQNQSLLRSGRTWASALVATVLTVTAFTASAKDEVPFEINWFITAITSHVDNPDGSYVETSVQVGNGTQLGRFTGADTVLVEGPADYSVELDPASGSLAAVVELAGTTTKTAANGDTIVFDYVGRVFIPLDENFNLTPPPWRLENIWEITGGTGRFAGASGHGTTEGTVVGDGTLFGVDVGVISTVGSN